MPIHDYDGAAWSEIGKIYDEDGTTTSQIAKVYDNDGTTDTLIYSAEEQLFPSGLSFEVGGTNSGYCSVTSTSLKAISSINNTNGNCHSTTTIDCSQYDKLIFTVSDRSASGNGGTWVGVASTGYADTNNSYVAYAAVSGTGDFTVDVSGQSGALYVVLSAWGSSGAASITVSKIMAE